MRRAGGVGERRIGKVKELNGRWWLEVYRTYLLFKRKLIHLSYWLICLPRNKGLN